MALAATKVEEAAVEAWRRKIPKRGGGRFLSVADTAGVDIDAPKLHGACLITSTIIEIIFNPRLDDFGRSK